MKKTRICAVVALILAVTFVFSACGSGGGTSPSPSQSPSGGTSPEASAPVDDHSDWITLDLKFASYLPDSNPLHQIIINALTKELDEVMPGKITFTLYPSGTLLGQSDIYDGILSGIADLGMIDFGPIVNRFPVTQLFAKPGTLSNTRLIAGGQVFYEWAQTTNTPEYNDVIVLWANCNGPMCFITTSPINTLEDLRGMQIRATASQAESIIAFGATPVSMDTSEVYEATRSGLIDGLYNSIGAGATMNLDEIAKEVLVNPMETFMQCTFLSKATLAKMPQSQQDAFMEAARVAFAKNITAMERNMKVGRIFDCIQNSNVRFLEGDLLAAFTAASASVLGDYVASLDNQGLNGTAELQRIRELAAKYDEPYTWADFVDNYFNSTFIEH